MAAIGASITVSVSLKKFDVSFFFGSEMKFKLKQVRKNSMDAPEIYWQNPYLTLLSLVPTGQYLFGDRSYNYRYFYSQAIATFSRLYFYIAQ